MSNAASCCRKIRLIVGALLFMRPVAGAGSEPRIFFIDVEAGPARGGPNNLGVPISIFGKGFGAVRGGSRVTIGGVEVGSYLVWGANNAHNSKLDMIVVQPGGKVAGGAVVVAVNGQPSNSDHVFTPNSQSIYYIAPNGRDSTVCSESAPCATILHAASSVMRPGDTLLVRGGTYGEGEIWIRSEQGGAPGQPKVIKGYPGEEVYLSNAARDFLVDAGYVTVSGFNFRNGKSLHAAGWASRNQSVDHFVNNTFTGNISWAAIETVGNEHLVAGNVCEVAGSSVGTMGHCYYVTQGSSQKILYNISSGPPGYGLHLYDERRATSDFQRVIRNVLVEGNIFKNSTQRSGMIIAMSDQGGYGNVIENVVIRNNIFAGNNQAGMVIQGIARDIKVYNNTFFQNGRQAMNISGGTNLQQVDVRNNLFYQSANDACRTDCQFLSEAHVQTGTPVRDITLTGNAYHPGSPVLLGRTDASPVTGTAHFEDPTSLDLRLKAGSAAIDRGAALPLVPVDFNGRSRPQGTAYDIGAFEYTSHSPALIGVVNGVSLEPGPASPGALVACLGRNLGPARPALVQMVDGYAMTSLAGTRALIDGVPAALFSVSENQVNVLAPFDLPDKGQVQLEIEVGGSRSNAVTVPMVAASPAIFTLDPSGRGQALIALENGTLNSADNPAEGSSIVTFYAAGLGPTDPPSVGGKAVVEQVSLPTASVSVQMGGVEAELLYAGTAAGLLDNVFQVNARVPQGAGPGAAVPLVLRVGVRESRNDVTLAIR